MGDLERLLVGPVARDVLALVTRGLTAHVRTNGGSVPSWAEPVLQSLAEAADVDPGVSSVVGTGFGTVEPIDRMVSLVDAAASVGKSPEYVRRLCRQGRVRCRRVGREWLVDPESLDNVLRRAA